MEAAPHPWPTLGVLLMRDGLVTKEELEALLAEQRDSRQQRITGRRLGEILVERGMVTQTQVSRLVAEQYELPFLELEESDIDLKVASLLTEELAQRYSAVPVGFLPDGSVLLAIADPATVIFSDELRRVLGAPTRFGVAGPEAIDAALTYVYTTAAPGAGDAQPDGHAETSSSALTDEEAGDRPYLGSQRAVAHLWPPLGALLVREGLVTDAELETALAQQRLSSSRRLGEILVERGIVTSADVARLVAEQYELPFIDLAAYEVEPTAAALLPEELARKYSALPIGYLPDGSLRVVVADPTHVLYSDELHRALGVPLGFAVAAPNAIDAAIAVTRARTQIAHAAVSDETPPVAAAAGGTEIEVDIAETWADTTVDEPSPEESEIAEPDLVDELTRNAVELVHTEGAAEERAAETDPPRAEGPDAGTSLQERTVAETSESAVVVDFTEAVESSRTVELAPVDESDTYDETEDTAPAAWSEAIEWIEPSGDSPAADADEGEGEETATVVEFTAVGETAETERPSEVPVEVEVAETFEIPDVGDVASVAETPELTVVGEGFAEEARASMEESDETVTPPVAEDDVPETSDEAAEEPPPALDEIDVAIERALSLGASTVHLSPQPDGVVVRARVDGMLRELETIPAADPTSVVSRLRTSHETDFSLDVVPTKHGERVTLHVQRAEAGPLVLDELGMAPEDAGMLRNAIRQPSGAILVCGPTDSGKTATLYAALQELDPTERAVTTIEDPIAHVLPGVDQVEVDTLTGRTFARGLQAILRADPDVVLVGETRDGETAATSLQAALSGRLVLASLHARSAAAAVQRLLDLGVQPGVLGTTLNCVVGQRLVRRVCPDCRETYYATEDELAELGQTTDVGPRLLARGRGCAACGETGFRGRAGVFEILPLTGRVRALVARGASTTKIQEAAVAAGMRTLREDGIRLCLEGVTTAAELRRVTGSAS